MKNYCSSQNEECLLCFIANNLPLQKINLETGVEEYGAVLQIQRDTEGIKEVLSLKKVFRDHNNFLIHKTQCEFQGHPLQGSE